MDDRRDSLDNSSKYSSAESDGEQENTKDTCKERTQLAIVLRCSSNDGFVCIKSDRHVPASIMQSLYDDKEATDVSLFGAPAPGMVGDSLSPIRAHKLVLKHASPHFLELFTADAYTDSHKQTYTFENVTHDSLRSIVEFIYKDKFEISNDGVLECVRNILVAAKYFIMTSLADACEVFLANSKQMDSHNYMSMWCFARKYSCLTLLDVTSRCIANNLAKIMQQAEYLNLKAEECYKLLLSEAFVDADDDERCLAAAVWLNHGDLNCRVAYVNDVLNMVPIDSEIVSRDTLLKLCESETIRSAAPELVHKMLVRAVKRMRPDYSYSINLPSSTPSSAWFVIGGDDHSDNKQFAKYDKYQRCWTRYPALPWSRYAGGACVVSDLRCQPRLVVMGGRKNGRITADIDEFDFETSEWSTSNAKMCRAREYLAVCSNNEQQTAFAFGASKRGEAEDCFRVEAYISGAGTSYVKTLAPMLPGRGYCAATFVRKHNCVWVAGGCNPAEGNRRLTNIDRYDILNEKWRGVCGAMETARHGVALAVMGSDMYIIGGADNYNDAVDQVEIFDIAREGTTSVGPTLNEARVGCSAVALDENVLCVLGGSNEEGEDLRTVEALDIREGKWTAGVIVPDMPYECSYFGFACF